MSKSTYFQHLVIAMLQQGKKIITFQRGDHYETHLATDGQLVYRPIERKKDKIWINECID